MKIDLVSRMFPPGALGDVPVFYSLLATSLFMAGHKDKTHVSDIRLIACSGVCLDKPALNVKISEVLIDTEI